MYGGGGIPRYRGGGGSRGVGRGSRGVGGGGISQGGGSRGVEGGSRGVGTEDPAVQGGVPTV